VQPDAVLSIQHRSRRIEFDQAGDQQQERRRDCKQEQTYDDVTAAADRGDQACFEFAGRMTPLPVRDDSPVACRDAGRIDDRFAHCLLLALFAR
jgi:hypothetical protein